MIDELLLFHGAKRTGGKKMATGRCASYKTVWDPDEMSYRKKCRRKKSSGLGGFGAVGFQKGLKASFASVKDVFLTGGIAAGGAIVTDRLFDIVQEKVKLEGYQASVAKAATGVALGLVIGKLFRKPRIGAAFAIGPIVLVALEIIHEITGETAGLGLMTMSRPPVYNPESMYADVPALAPAMGAVQVGTGVPRNLMYSATAAPTAYPFAA